MTARTSTKQERQTTAGKLARLSQSKERAIPTSRKKASGPRSAGTPSLPPGEHALGVLDHLLVFRFRRVRDHITATYREFTTESRGLKAGVFTTLALIEANTGISQIDLSRLGGFDQAVLVGILDDLEARGWAVRSKDKADRRRHMLEITEEGRTALAELFRLAEENEATARNALTAREYAQLDKALSKMYHHLF